MIPRPCGQDLGPGSNFRVQKYFVHMPFVQVPHIKGGNRTFACGPGERSDGDKSKLGGDVT